MATPAAAFVRGLPSQESLRAARADGDHTLASGHLHTALHKPLPAIARDLDKDT